LATSSTPPISRARTALRALPVAAWGLIAALCAASVMGLEPNLVEEGMMLHIAERLARGERLYRDVVFFTGPLPFELLAGLFRVFGAEIAVGRLFMVGAQAAAAACIFVFARRAGAGAFAHAAAAVVAVSPLLLFPLFSGFYYTPLALQLAYFAALAALLGISSPAWAAVAGVACAAVALCKQTLGVILAGALLATLVANCERGTRVRRALAFTAGGAAVAAVTLLAFAARGDLAALVHWLVSVPIALESQYSSPMINFWPPGEIAPELYGNKALYIPNHWFQLYGILTRVTPLMVLTTQLLYALPFVALAATALARLARPLPAAVWLNGAVLLALTSNLFPRTDWGHVVFVIPPACIQLFLLAGRIGAARARRPRGATLAAGVCVALLLACGAGFAVWLNQASGSPTYGPRVPLRPVSAAYRSRNLPNVVQYLRQRVQPGEPIFVARAEPLIYFATGTTNPTPYPGILTAFSEEQEDKILAALPRTRFVVMSEVDQPLWTYYSDELPRVQAELERYYRIAPYFPVGLESWIVVLERDVDRGPTAIDLIEHPARAWVRDEPGQERDEPVPAPRLPARHNRRTLGMRLGSWGGGLDWQIDVPPGARLQVDTGFIGMASNEDMHEHPLRSRIVISLGRNGAFETLDRHVLHLNRSDTPHWQPIEVDLSGFAGERVTLRIALEAEFAVGTRDLAWLGSPRIALAPEPAASDAPRSPSQ
jgi:hypothetical protein